jgi:hypothetical protein
MSDIDALSPAQEVVMLALLSGESQRGAAAAGGVNEATVSRWLDDDHAFYRVYSAKRADVWQRYEGRIALLVDQALASLEFLMRGHEYTGSDDYSPSTRLAAAQTVLKMAGLLQSPTRIASFGGQVNVAQQQIVNGRDNSPD